MLCAHGSRVEKKRGVKAWPAFNVQNMTGSARKSQHGISHISFSLSLSLPLSLSLSSPKVPTPSLHRLFNSSINRSINLIMSSKAYVSNVPIPPVARRTRSASRRCQQHSTHSFVSSDNSLEVPTTTASPISRRQRNRRAVRSGTASPIIKRKRAQRVVRYRVFLYRVAAAIFCHSRIMEIKNFLQHLTIA